MNSDLLPGPEPFSDDASEHEPFREPEESEENIDLDYVEMPCTDGVFPGNEDDECWEVFIPDEDQWYQQPGPRDFHLLLLIPTFALAA